MKTNHIYEITLCGYLQKLFKSKGESILLISTIVLTVIIVTINIGSLSAQSKNKKGTTVKLLDLPELKKYEYLPDMVQDMPLEFQYFNGKKSVVTSFGAIKDGFIQLFFWDASYPEHFTDLKKIFDYGEEMGAHSTFILVVSKSDKATLAGVKAACERFKKEFGVDMDIAFVIGNPNLDKLFKVDVFPKYVQINKDAVFVDEKAATDLFKMRDRSKLLRNGK